MHFKQLQQQKKRMMQPMPMPVRPRLPMGGIQLAGGSAISKELAITTCPEKCCDHVHNEKATTANAASTSSSSLKQPPLTTSGGSDNHNALLSPLPMDHHHHPQQGQGQSSFSNLESLFKIEDITEDILIQSTEPMVFDDSILSQLVQEEGTNNKNANGPAPAPTPFVAPPPPEPVCSHHHHQQHHKDTNNMNTSTSKATPEGVDALVLHRTVVLFPNDANLVQTALTGSPPQAILSRSPMPHLGYSFPLHMAICQGANLPVLQLLVQAGPQVLLQKDGPQGFTPLLLSLTHLPHRPDVHQLLLKAWPQAASIPCEANQDLPLHVACRNSAQRNCIDLIQGLLQAHPAAAIQVNARGLTPLNIIALQPMTAPHRTLLYQSLQQQVALVQQQQQQQQPQQSSSTMARGGGGRGVLTAPC